MGFKRFLKSVYDPKQELILSLSGTACSMANDPVLLTPLSLKAQLLTKKIVLICR